jgi:hypothetical protein
MCACGKSSALAIHAVAPLPLPFAAARESAPAAWRACCRGRRLADAGGGWAACMGGAIISVSDFESRSPHGPVGRCDKRRARSGH